MSIVSNRNIIVSVFVVLVILVAQTQCPATRGEKLYRLKALLVKLVVNKIINRITIL